MRALKIVLVLLATILVAAAAALYLSLRGSLPQLDGALAIDALRHEVTIERDALGVVTLTAQDRLDAAFATGFVHAQERFFQMDLQRRAAAGELAALFGSVALNVDRANRVHRLRHRAQQLVAQLPADEAALYRAYTEGVNTGIDALATAPFEYLLLRQEPVPWRAEDIALTVYSMYFELTDETAARESELGFLADVLHPDAYRWIVQSGTDWDAPLRGEAMPAAPLPGPDALDLRGLPAAAGLRDAAASDSSRLLPGLPGAGVGYETHAPGSNSWAVSAARSATGRAIVAGDMHLGHGVPNIWFRGRIVVPDEGLDINGVTLPGTPLVVAGSNGHVAWAFTNSYGDWSDLIELELKPGNPDSYRVPGGWRDFEQVSEAIEIAGGETETLRIRETAWGPVIDEDHRGRLRALRWLPHLVEATNIGIAGFETARNLEGAMAAANRTGAPPQNFVVADSSGRIGWTIMGQIPRRVGYDPARPSSWANGAGWQGWTDPADYPRIVDPPAGVLWTANARTVDGEWLALLGEGNHPNGARARQIRDRLQDKPEHGIDDMLALQLDDRALFLNHWRELLLDTVLTDDVVADHPQRAEFRRLVADWGARAAVDSAGYRLVRAYRLETLRLVMDGLLSPVREIQPGFVLRWHSQLERPVWQAINERPAHLLNPAFASWDALLLAAVAETIAEYDFYDGDLSARTWGERNTAAIRHPLSRAVPALSRFLDMPGEPLPGDSNMPRVQSPTFGASQRMAVSPGDEANGYFHMPGGQSGHPLSPFYGSGHGDWAEGRPTPFLPGPTQHRLVLQPAR